MRLFRYILTSINVLNLILITAVAASAFFLLYPLLNGKASYKIPTQAQQAPVRQEEERIPGQTPPVLDYMVVAEQNIFHPERKIPLENKDEKPLAKPEIILYGTLLADDMRVAYIEDKKSLQSSPGRGNRQTVVKQGDVVSGFILQNVETDRIVLVRGEDQIIVLLNDIKKTRSALTLTQPTGAQPGTRPVSPPGTQPGTLPAVTPATAAVVPPMQVMPQQPPASPEGTSPSGRQSSSPARTSRFTRPAEAINPLAPKVSP